MLLEVRNLKARYGESQALFGVDLDIDYSQVVSLVGRNGMGKTTTVNSIMGITASFEGSITFAGEQIRGLASYHVARSGIGLVPEGRQIFPNLTVRENLVATEFQAQTRSAWTLERVLEMFPELAERQSSMGNLLSGGEQQMLAIGRALMINPRLLILDEATEGLAPLIRQKIWRCLHHLKNDGHSILVIDKNLNDLLKIADRHHIIEKGRVVWSGDSQSLSENRNELEQYLGI